jgi:hypothetical protein
MVLDDRFFDLAEQKIRAWAAPERANDITMELIVESFKDLWETRIKKNYKGGGRMITQYLCPRRLARTGHAVQAANAHRRT